MARFPSERVPLDSTVAGRRHRALVGAAGSARVGGDPRATEGADLGAGGVRGDPTEGAAMSVLVSSSRRLGALVCAVVALAAGCGDDGDTASETSTTLGADEP